jgi:hypothetical protein
VRIAIKVKLTRGIYGMKIFRYMAIVLCIFSTKYVFGESQRFMHDFSISIPIDEKAVPLLKVYLAAYEALKPYVKAPSPTEELKSVTHICNNDSDPVVACDHSMVQDVKDLNVDAIPVKVEPKPTPTPTPKP